MSEKSKYYIVLSFILVPFFVYVVYFNFMLNTKGRFKIATYIGSTKGGREGGDDYFSFKYNNQIYIQGIQTIRSKIPKYVFCKFVPSNPNICKIYYDLVVPYCLLTISTPHIGWDSIPQIECIENKETIYAKWVEYKK